MVGSLGSDSVQSDHGGGGPPEFEILGGAADAGGRQSHVTRSRGRATRSSSFAMTGSPSN